MDLLLYRFTAKWSTRAPVFAMRRMIASELYEAVAVLNWSIGLFLLSVGSFSGDPNQCECPSNYSC